MLFTKRYRNAILLTTSLIVVWTTGCANTFSMHLSTQQADELKAQLGYIGVVSAGYTPDVNVKVPARNAAEGAKEGAKIPLQMAVFAMQGCGGSAEFCLLALASGIALAPVGALVGGVETVLFADNAEVVTIREATIKQSLVDLRMHEHVRDRFTSRLADQLKFPAKILLAPGPEKKGHEQDYRLMKSIGIDTVSEISVQTLWLDGLGVIRPNLSLFLHVQVRLISTADNRQLIAKTYTCHSKEHRFEEWAAQDARKFREEIDRCYNVIAENSVTDLFEDNTLLKASHL